MGRAAPRLIHATTVPDTLWAFFAGQLGYFRERGFDVHAVAAPGPLLERFAAREAVPVHAVPMVRGFAPIGDALACARLTALFRRLAPDIVHAHTPKAGLLALLAARAARVPVRIYHLHGLRGATLAAPARVIVERAERLTCALAQRVLCVGPSLCRTAAARGLAPQHKLACLGLGSFNGVDARGRFDPARYNAEIRRQVRARWGIPAEARVLGFVGRVVRDKGVPELMTAWTSLRAAYPDLHLLIVGPPGRARWSGQDLRVHLTGEQWEVAPLYAAMDVVALPSHREGFGMVTLEAAAMELPVVASATDGSRDALLDGVTGTLVPPRDAAALAAALAAYLDDPALARRHGTAGRQRALAGFDPPRIWSELERVYRELLA